MIMRPFSAARAIIAWTLLSGVSSYPASLPPGGLRLFPVDGQKLELVGLHSSAMKTVAVTNQAFAEAIEVDVDRQGANPWAFRVGAPILRPAGKGDAIHLRFWARTAYSMTGSAELAVVVEEKDGPMEKIADVPLTVGTAWECVDLPFAIGKNLGPGDWKFSIRLAYKAQRVQIAGVEVLNFGSTLKLDQLPRRQSGYAGREPGAAWRQAALERIERIRKGNLTVTVVDAAGNPVTGAQVHAVMERHAFGFGTCVSMRLLDPGPDGERYRKTLKELFNCVVIENELKWPAIERHRYANSDRLIDWCVQNQLPVRGHCLIWPGRRTLPQAAMAVIDQPDRLRPLIEEHLTTTVSRYRGRLIDWDVINEPYANHLVMDKLGREVMVDWFKLAHAADPKAMLYINDYEILASGNMLNTPHQNHYFDTIRFLLDRGAPVHGIGMQGHFGSNITSPEKLLSILDRFAALGLRIKVTEMDLLLSDEDLRADYYRDFFITLFSHPSVDAILQWGFWEGSHWIPRSAILQKDWTWRRHGLVYRDLVLDQWKTDVTLLTDDTGKVALRGFLGDYRIEISKEGATVSLAGKVVKEQSVLRAVLSARQ